MTVLFGTPSTHVHAILPLHRIVVVTLSSKGYFGNLKSPSGLKGIGEES
jgi:hypothetical protein